MEPVHLHLALSHAPLFLVAVAALAFGLAIFWNRETLTRFGLILVILSALVAVPIFLTGEPAEERAEGLPGVSEAAIERHEEAAGVALALVGVLGGIAVIGLLVLRGRQVPRAAPIGAAGLALVGVLAMGYVASLGGHIRHTEIAGDTPRDGIEERSDRAAIDRRFPEDDDDD